MAHRALLRSKLFFPGFIFLLAPAACKQVGTNTIALPYIYVNAAQDNTEIINGICYTDKKPFTGCLYALQPGAKDSLFACCYIAGKEDGYAKKWYPGGAVKEIRYYSEGRKTGTHKGFWPDGSLSFRFHYVQDIYEGTQYRWFESGRLYTQKNYHKGQEEGMQQEWDTTGKLTVNYQSLNGRQYGNIGKKNCSSLWADTVYHKPAP